MSPRLAYVNILARDIDALSGFYARLLGFSEIEGHRSPIYRCLDAGGMELGFNAAQAYELLQIEDRRPKGRGPVQVYLTFEVGSPEEVGALAATCAELGGRIVKPPYDTYYNARQAVLEDPDGNVFRVNCRKGPRRPAHEVVDPPWRT
jgi:catechol 2,3-dioxygenase-like lactoylglutathione lyase family enzyme